MKLKANVRFLCITLPMLRLLSSKAQVCEKKSKPFKPSHVGIHEIALTDYSQMITHIPGFQSFFQRVCVILYWKN